MGRWSNIVKISTGPTSGHDEVRRIFSNVGEIRGVYPYYRGDDNGAASTQLFLEFSEDAGATRAIAFQELIPHIKVRSLDSDPGLVEQYRTVMAEARREARTTGQSQKHIPGSYQSDNASNPTQIAGASSSSGLTAVLNPSDGAAKRISSLVSPFNVETPLSQAINSFSATLLPTPGSVSLQNSSPNIVSSLFSTKAGHPPPVMAFSLDSQLSITFHGETFTYDLNSIGRDVRPIIQLLKLSTSEPGTWMTAAAYYRRKGYVQSSVDILMSMLESMKQLDISEDKLRPVFLMLSGCETDMAKAAKAQTMVDPTLVAQHYEISKKWLHKVYGVDIPQHSTKALDSSFAAQTVLASIPLPEKNTSVASSHSTKPRTDHSPLSRPLPSRARDESENLPPYDEYHHHTRAPSQTALLSAQRAKRRLEEDCIYEREQRRRVERELREMAHERDAARRSEDRAKERMRDEIDARRKAEATVDRERALRKDSEKRITAPLLEDLAHLFKGKNGN